MEYLQMYTEDHVHHSSGPMVHFVSLSKFIVLKVGLSKLI